eukprot:SAG31_NODE_54_length_29987_cov_4.570664_12_plen_179_part_00
MFLGKLGEVNGSYGHTDSVYSVAFSPDGEALSTLLNTLPGLGDLHVLTVVYSTLFCAGKYLASGSLDHSLILWDVTQARAGGGARGNIVSKFSGHEDFVLSVTFNRDAASLFLLSGSKDRTVRGWDARQPSAAAGIVKLLGHDNSVISVAHSAAGGRPRFATGSGDKRARIWSYTRLA